MLSLTPFIDYIPAQLTQGKRWYITYYVKHPETNVLVRKQIKVNRIVNIPERKKFARELVLNINDKLRVGWNPFIEQDAPKGFTPLRVALTQYLRSKTKEFTSEDSVRTYTSIINVLLEYVDDVLKKPDLLAISFDVATCNRFMTWVFDERDVGCRTFNNYRRFGVTIWNWLIANLYCKANVFQTVMKKKESAKIRKNIDAASRVRIKEYLLQGGEIEFLAICQICYYGFIRPKEILHLKPEHVNMEANVFFLTSDLTKDNDNRVVTMPADLKETLAQLNIDTINKENYIFSTGFKPGKVLKNSRDIGKRWSKLRSDLKLPMSYQFYSLKDTGIVDLLQQGVSAKEVQNQAGHSSLEMTDKYARLVNHKASEQILTKSTNF